MIFKSCEICGKVFSLKTSKKTCSPKCRDILNENNKKIWYLIHNIRLTQEYKENKNYYQQKSKNYYKLNKEKCKKTQNKYYLKNKKYYNEFQNKWRKLNPHKVKENNKRYRDSHKDKINEDYKKRLKNDESFRISCYLRNRLNFILKKYTKTGKIMSSRKYGIDYKSIIEYLKPLPENLEDYHIHHKKELFKFKFTNNDGSQNLIAIKEAFAPENHKLVLIDEHREIHKKLNHFKSNPNLKNNRLMTAKG